jgi:hypothetical protein
MEPLGKLPEKSRAGNGPGQREYTEFLFPRRARAEALDLGGVPRARRGKGASQPG